MKTEELGKSRFLNLLFKPGGWAMESRLRLLLHDPLTILQGADVRPGQTVLEVGAGTGFFTLPAARLIGESGRLIAMEPLADYAARLRERLEAAQLDNVEVVQRDALNTGLESASLDRALLFGVLPFPTLPLKRLLPEMQRVLKAEGILAVWMFPVAGWVPGAIERSEWFAYLDQQNGVYTYEPLSAPR